LLYFCRIAKNFYCEKEQPKNAKIWFIEG